MANKSHNGNSYYYYCCDDEIQYCVAFYKNYCYNTVHAIIAKDLVGCPNGFVYYNMVL